MSKKAFALIAGGGCLLVLILVLGVVALFLYMGSAPRQALAPATVVVEPTLLPGARATQVVVPTLTPGPPIVPTLTGERASQGVDLGPLVDLYHRVNPGVVHIQVFVQQFGQQAEGAGSGFVLDNQGHIVTNNHVVAEATQIFVVFYNGFQARAEIVGRDADSDLAVIRVDTLPEGAHPLPLGDSDRVEPGQAVIAIGSPFGLGSSMTFGIVSAVGRTIPSGATAFSIPQAIQTDAAINPGNSGGPLINMQGEVIGVNAQIATGGVRANAGVGFAIPVNVVRRVAPVLIRTGSFRWPWLGVQGTSVNLLIQQANGLDTQQGAYIDAVVRGGPAAQAGLQGSTGTRTIEGIEVPVGGDVILEIDGNPVQDFADLLSDVSAHNPGDRVTLTVLRNGRTRQVTVQLEVRPSS
ncbi:MAG: trypsin-like peptidase domain-containing protein [Chloroflexi bacterium]|nr:trypsin-like peptidase domain-containing protein [Chloroflexota bacterium]